MTYHLWHTHRWYVMWHTHSHMTLTSRIYIDTHRYALMYTHIHWHTLKCIHMTLTWRMCIDMYWNALMYTHIHWCTLKCTDIHSCIYTGGLWDSASCAYPDFRGHRVGGYFILSLPPPPVCWYTFVYISAFHFIHSCTLMYIDTRRYTLMYIDLH